MRGVQGPSRTPRTLYSFHTPEDVQQFATGCDGDQGGLTTVNFDFDARPEIHRSLGSAIPGSALFWGDMRTKVKSGMEGKIRGGWSGFRNKPRPSLFGNLTDDASGHDYIALRLRVAGDPQTHNSYFVNVQTAGPISTDLWQHRLFFQKGDGAWENVYIPLESFVRTNAGRMSENQIEMWKEKVKSVGISLLGGNSGVEGKYELNVESIRLVNEEDIDT
ncbi:NADH:ubiquinone oxidoreductase intermediate-associated protein 30 [Crepidotus variabilis]|uniref:NADH:ubiquinone oxidoreductase intermediate-associated protein 30 n=1 Tax=Crepidotus variabilis TaxID=179855 RepID=A0A9P6JT17_9AGAR|nr:NADH:ubiquinone oxidoreductase intermediate-associated protein 30 [Crepidotus variabilis]